MKTRIEYPNMKIKRNIDVLFETLYPIAQVSREATIVQVGYCRFPFGVTVMAKVPFKKMIGVPNREFSRRMTVQLENLTLITLYFAKKIKSEEIDSFMPGDKIRFEADLVSEYGGRYSQSYDLKFLTNKIEFIEYGPLHA